MKNINYNSHKIKALMVILLFIIGFYLTFLYIDIFHPEQYSLSKKLKLSCIILCFTITLLTGEDSFDDRNIKLLQIGFFLTIIADLFLLILNSHTELGVFMFCIVQIIYSIRYDNKGEMRTIRKAIIIFSVIVPILIIINYHLIKIDSLIILSIFYGICLLISVTKGFRTYADKLYPKSNGFIVALGMILFLLCDINVALFNILGFLDLNSKILNTIYRISSISIWFFYLPSQVLLSISGYKYN